MPIKNNPMEEAQKQLNSLQPDTFTSTELKKDSGIVEGIKQLQDFKHIFSVTRISGRSAVLFSKALTIARFWGINEIEDILKELAIINLSVDAKRSDDIVKILAGVSSLKNKSKLQEALKPEMEK